CRRELSLCLTRAEAVSLCTTRPNAQNCRVEDSYFLQIPISVFVIVPFAPATKPSEVSRTSPDTVPAPVCATAGKTVSARAVKTINPKHITLRTLRRPSTQDSMFTSTADTSAPGKLEHLQ